MNGGGSCGPTTIMAAAAVQLPVWVEDVDSSRPDAVVHQKGAGLARGPISCAGMVQAASVGPQPGAEGVADVLP